MYNCRGTGYLLLNSVCTCSTKYSQLFLLVVLLFYLHSQENIPLVLSSGTTLAYETYRSKTFHVKQ